MSSNFRIIEINRPTPAQASELVRRAAPCIGRLMRPWLREHHPEMLVAPVRTELEHAIAEGVSEDEVLAIAERASDDI